MEYELTTSIVIPLLSGVLVCVVFFFLDKSRFAVRGVVGPYFTAVALIFALFFSLLTTETWQKVNRANALLVIEASGVRAMLRIVEPLGPQAEPLLAQTHEFLEQLREQEKLADAGTGQAFPPTIYRSIYKVAAQPELFGNNPVANLAFYTELEKVRAAWFERLQLRKTHIRPEKLHILMLFGLLTQIAIAFCHAGQFRALCASVMLFGVAFSTSSAVLSTFDDPFHSSYLLNGSVLEDVK